MSILVIKYFNSTFYTSKNNRDVPAIEELCSPTRDKMIIWSAVVGGCGIMALLGRHTAIYRFGTDESTGNILFAVFFILLIGLYQCSTYI